MIKAKKSLGQNFLIDKKILEKITSIEKIQDKTVLEIGPGTGNLTSYILKKKPRKFFIVEKDNNLVVGLQKKFHNNLEIINDDILNINEKKLSQNKLIVFGNLPYNISTEILCKWIINLDNEKFWFESLILMFQKEVADRIVAKVNTSNYGRLSILAKWKLNITKVCDINPSSFWPKPKIESSLLVFKPKKNFFRVSKAKNIELITRSFFNHRRKMIKKPFNQLFNGNDEIKNKLRLNLDLRPQNLNFDTYYNLAKEYEELTS
ncbi:16S rRNA (adenine(1518)-N(6)/adenine(1519)-N(6))-dimethyltransferase RsmA [Candidatus Pelagibacter sp.]|nr:16S rRNA (adenine(1518)-N(6)/adenine(1519)-N(6))-dimethyltransferase RsmA [Candidatus Pelagibacter sp.]